MMHETKGEGTSAAKEVFSEFGADGPNSTLDKSDYAKAAKALQNAIDEGVDYDDEDSEESEDDDGLDGLF